MFVTISENYDLRQGRYMCLGSCDMVGWQNVRDCACLKPGGYWPPFPGHCLV